MRKELIKNEFNQKLFIDKYCEVSDFGNFKFFSKNSKFFYTMKNDLTIYYPIYDFPNFMSIIVKFSIEEKNDFLIIKGKATLFTIFFTIVSSIWFLLILNQFSFTLENFSMVSIIPVLLLIILFITIIVAEFNSFFSLIKKNNKK